MKRRAFLERVSIFGIPIFGVGATAQSAPLAHSSSSNEPQTDAERIRGVVPVRPEYEPGNVLRYGAERDGVTDDTRAVQDAVNAAATVIIPPGTYLIRNKVDLRSGVSVVGYGGPTLKTDGTSYIFYGVGRIGSRVALTQDARIGNTWLSLSPSHIPAFGQSDGYALQSDKNPLGHTRHQAGELGLTKSIDTNKVQTLTLVMDDYLVSDNAHAAPVKYLTDIEISGLKFENTNFDTDPTKRTSQFVYLELVRGFKISDCVMRKNNSGGIAAFNCLDGLISGNIIGMLGDGSGVLGYGVQLGFSSQNISVANNSLFQCRHAVTTGTGSRASKTPNYGVSRGLAIVGNTVSHCTHAGLDTHADSDGVTITGNTVIGCRIVGIHTRSYRTTISGNTISACSGRGIRVARSARDTAINGNTVHGISMHGNFGFGIEADSPSISISNNRISESASHGIAVNHNGRYDISINGNVCKNNGKAASGDGINVNAQQKVSGVTITSNHCFDNQSEPTQRHGLMIEASTILDKVDCLISANNLSRSRDKSFQNRSRGSVMLVGNTAGQQ